MFVLTNVGTWKTATRYVQTTANPITVNYGNHIFAHWPMTFTL